MSTAFPPALRSSIWIPQIPGALPHLNRFTAACVSKNEGGPQLIGGSAIGIVTPLTSNSTAGGSAWSSRSNKLPGGPSFRTPLSRAHHPLLSLQYTEGWTWMNAMREFPCQQDENHLTTGDALPVHRFLARRPPCPPLVHYSFMPRLPEQLSSAIQAGPATLVNGIQCPLRDKILLCPPVISKTSSGNIEDGDLEGTPPLFRFP